MHLTEYQLMVEETKCFLFEMIMDIRLENILWAKKALSFFFGHPIWTVFWVTKLKFSWFVSFSSFFTFSVSAHQNFRSFLSVSLSWVNLDSARIFDLQLAANTNRFLTREIPLLTLPFSQDSNQIRTGNLEILSHFT